MKQTCVSVSGRRLSIEDVYLRQDYLESLLLTIVEPFIQQEGITISGFS